MSTALNILVLQIIAMRYGGFEGSAAIIDR